MADDIVVIDIVLKVRTEEEGDGEPESQEDIKEETPSTEPAPKEIPTSPIETQSPPEPTLPKPEPELTTPISTPAPEPRSKLDEFLEREKNGEFEDWIENTQEMIKSISPETKATIEQEVELLQKQVGTLLARRDKETQPASSAPPLTEPTSSEEEKPTDEKKPEIDPEKLKEFQDFIDQLDSKGIQTLSQFAKNPTGFTQNGVLGVLGRLGPHGAIVASIIAAVIATPELITTLVEALAVKGAIFNQDFHRRIEEEIQFGLDRELQYRRAVGLDIIITTSHRGYSLPDPAHVYSNFIDLDETVADRTYGVDHMYGYYTGI